jgi:hypothetical protein
MTERVQTPPSLTVDKGEKTDVGILVTAMVSLIQGGVTGLDLLVVFLSRRIQPLQERVHPMWQYTGANDSTRVHPEDVEEKMVEQWIKCITGARDNLRGSRRIPPYDANNQPLEVRHAFPSELLMRKLPE